MAATAPGQVLELALAHVRPSKDNPRKSFAPGPLAELAKSIKERGVLEPILVMADPERAGAYLVIAGERRLRASKLAGRSTIPAIVREENSSTAAELRLIENLQREDLTVLEKARGYAGYLKATNKSQAELAKALAKTEAHVSQVLAVLTLPGPAVELVANGTLGLKHVRELNRLKDHPAIAKRIVADVRSESRVAPVTADTLKGWIDDELEELEQIKRAKEREKSAAAAVAKAKAGRPAPASKLSKAELATRAKVRLAGMLTRARNAIILERAPRLAQTVMRELKRIKLPDELYVILCGPADLYGIPPLAYAHVPRTSHYGVELANRILPHLPGSWRKNSAGTVPRAGQALDLKARRSWVALWVWLALRAKGLDAELDRAAHARVKAIKAKPAKRGKAKPKTKGR